MHVDLMDHAEQSRENKSILTNNYTTLKTLALSWTNNGVQESCVMAQLGSILHAAVQTNNITDSVRLQNDSFWEYEKYSRITMKLTVLRGINLK